MKRTQTGFDFFGRYRANQYNGRKAKSITSQHPVARFFIGLWRLGKIVSAVSFGLAAVGAISFILILGYHQVVHSSYFQVKKVILKDLNQVSQKEVLDLTGLDKPVNILALKLRNMAENLRSHPWISDVNLARKMPDTIIIEVEERRPMALIRLGELYYLDRSGTPFQKVNPEDKIVLPIIAGFSRMDFVKRPESVHQELQDVFQFLVVVGERNDRFRLENIAEISFDSVRGLTLFTREPKLEVRVGFGDYQIKFRRLGRVLAYLKIRGHEQGLVYVNLECGPRVIIRRTVKS
ncbi:MAG: FtsQ-type POTRA domain-containing protein [Deltaproteobacteria bacterium]|nr:FtsQ-type POTRA domain-containing protein [Deltaproteobacteria bacterium]MBW2084835.1 FtsQ-type POTRA domain-containing protein [Deltaproteobacteria bacterium]